LERYAGVVVGYVLFVNLGNKFLAFVSTKLFLAGDTLCLLPESIDFPSDDRPILISGLIALI